MDGIWLMLVFACFAHCRVNRWIKDKRAAWTKDICNPLQYHKPHLSDSSKYFECRPLTNMEQKNWGIDNLGVWVVRSCPDSQNEEFDELFQKCENKRKRRRQYLACGNNPGTSGCSTTCTASNENPINGNPCSWASSNLSPDPSNPRHFFQCAPVTPGDSCGQWCRMFCPPGAQFNPQLQICILINLQNNNCLPTQVPICNCGSNRPDQVTTCPGRGVCQSGTCCLSVRVDSPALSYPMGQSASPMCSSGAPPVGPCSACPSTMCQPDIGCCPGHGQKPAPVCPDGGLPVCSCDSGCPKSTMCQSNVGCCPLPLQNNALPAQIPQCPGGGVPQMPCNSGNCPPSLACQPNTGCCPIQTVSPATLCLSGHQPMGQCSAGCPLASTHCEPNVGCCPLPDNFMSSSFQSPVFIPRIQSLNIQIVLKCPGGEQPVGLCSSGCPTNAICMQGVCCQSSTNQRPPANSQSCSNGMRPVWGCSAGCPMTTSCQPGVGCCPTTSDETQARRICNNGMKPIMPCFLGCPGGTSCESSGCCPMQGMVSLQGTSNTICPDGSRSLSQCSPSCPLGTACQTSIGCCHGPSTAPSDSLFPSKPIVITIRMCSSGDLPVESCSGSTTCPTGTICTEAGCCPFGNMPCPNGLQPLGSCSSGCPVATSCQPQIGCCPAEPTAQLCPGGVQPYSGCAKGCPPTTFCQPNVGCCPENHNQGLIINVQICSNGQQPVSPCNNGCPPGTMCQQGNCCPITHMPAPIVPPPPVSMPLCSGGQIPISSCVPNQGCPTGFECASQGCCPASPTMCPNGVTAQGVCPGGSGCRDGTPCQNSACCPLPTCPNGAQSSRPCSSDNQCSSGHLCIGGGCCFQHMPQPTSCLPNQQAICQCSPNKLCPQGSSCVDRVCCFSNQPTVGNQLPGGSCMQSNQCSGFSSNTATCASNGACSCSAGSWSNGVGCVPGPQPQHQQNCCNQYAGPCRFTFNKFKRRPQLEPIINNVTAPIFFVTLDGFARRCLNNNTCTPNEICINETCKTKKSPGEYGCKTDQECNHRCSSAFCHIDHKKNLGVCKCSNAYAFADLCYVTCPKGTIKDDYRCKMVNEQNEFWDNEEKRKELEKAHSCRKFSM